MTWLFGLGLFGSMGLLFYAVAAGVLAVVTSSQALSLGLAAMCAGFAFACALDVAEDRRRGR